MGTVISVTLTLFAAYPLSRVDLKIRGPVMFLFTVTMFFSGGMIPTYLVVSKLHLIDTFWAVSYTHLDVYKRQCYRRENRRREYGKTVINFSSPFWENLENYRLYLT